MSRPSSEMPYQNHVPYYYAGNYQQFPARMPAMDYHYNGDSSYPQTHAPVPWPLYRSAKDELVSPLANNLKFQYSQGQSVPVQPAQYAAAYMVHNAALGVHVPRSEHTNTDHKSEHRPDGDASAVPPRSGTALMAHLPRATKLALLDPGSGSDGSEPSSGRSSTKLQKTSKSSGASSAAGDMASNVCDVCGKEFQKPYNLKSHMKTHSTDRPFKCSFCLKTFARSHDRKRHENLHGGQKNFKCEGYLRNGVTKWGCGKQFARSDALSRHFRTETGYLCIKQFMDEEKEREGDDPRPAELSYPHHQMHPAHPYYHAPQNAPSAQHQHAQHGQHAQQYAVNGAVRSYEPVSYGHPQISLPPLLRH